MKDFHCKDVGMSCDFVARGNTDDEILKQAKDHGQKVHQLNLTPDLEQKVRSVIHDENSPAHQRSLGKMPLP